MRQCTGCGQENAILFEQKGGPLCWLCSSRRKAADDAGRKRNGWPEKTGDRRAWPRCPVNIHVKLAHGTAEASKVIFPGTAVNICEGGMCIEWSPCGDCRGYVQGSIHPECVFAPHSRGNRNGDVLYVSLFLSEQEVVHAAAEAVYVNKAEEEREYIGIAFADGKEHLKTEVRNIIDKVQDNG